MKAVSSIRHTSILSIAAIAALILAGIATFQTSDVVSARQSVSIDADDIGGIVTGPGGPEAGVWVIAETDDLDTLLRKIVVTDDAGRYVLPDLPDAEYRVWVRGYGIADSRPLRSRPGESVELTVRAAENPLEAAQVYPANYWYSLIEVPTKDEFPGTGRNGNGISPGMRTQAHWIDGIKQGCQLCHQLGNQITREILDPTAFDSTVAAWAHRVKTGQRGARMDSTLNRFGRDRAINMYADWTDRIMAGAVPKAPPRPQGLERNVVLTMWEWGGSTRAGRSTASSLPATSWSGSTR